MTEQNLAMILGPNILHKEIKVSVWLAERDREECEYLCVILYTTIMQLLCNLAQVDETD